MNKYLRRRIWTATIWFWLLLFIRSFCVWRCERGTRCASSIDDLAPKCTMLCLSAKLWKSDISDLTHDIFIFLQRMLKKYIYLKITHRKKYLWFKHKSLGDIISLPMLRLSIICLNQPNCTFDFRVRMLIVLCMLELNVQQAWLKHITLNLSTR